MTAPPPPFHSRHHMLRVALHADGGHIFDRWAAQIRAWWNTERPPLGRHHPDFPRLERPAEDEAA